MFLSLYFAGKKNDIMLIRKAGWCLAPRPMVELGSNSGLLVPSSELLFVLNIASRLVSGKCPVLLDVGSYLEAEEHCMTSCR